MDHKPIQRKYTTSHKMKFPFIYRNLQQPYSASDHVEAHYHEYHIYLHQHHPSNCNNRINCGLYHYLQRDNDKLQNRMDGCSRHNSTHDHPTFRHIDDGKKEVSSNHNTQKGYQAFEELMEDDDCDYDDDEEDLNYFYDDEEDLIEDPNILNKSKKIIEEPEEILAELEESVQIKPIPLLLKNIPVSETAIVSKNAFKSESMSDDTTTIRPNALQQLYNINAEADKRKMSETAMVSQDSFQSKPINEATTTAPTTFFQNSYQSANPLNNIAAISQPQKLRILLLMEMNGLLYHGYLDDQFANARQQMNPSVDNVNGAKFFVGAEPTVNTGPIISNGDTISTSSSKIEKRNAKSIPKPILAQLNGSTIKPNSNYAVYSPTNSPIESFKNFMFVDDISSKPGKLSSTNNPKTKTFDDDPILAILNACPMLKKSSNYGEYSPVNSPEKSIENDKVADDMSSTVGKPGSKISRPMTPDGDPILVKLNACPMLRPSSNNGEFSPASSPVQSLENGKPEDDVSSKANIPTPKTPKFDPILAKLNSNYGELSPPSNPSSDNDDDDENDDYPMSSDPEI